MVYAYAEKRYVGDGFGSAEEYIEILGGVDSLMEFYLSEKTINVYNFDDEVVKGFFRLKNEHTEEVSSVYILEPIDNLDLVVEEVLKLDKNITDFKYYYPDMTRNEPVYPLLTPEQQQRLGEKFPALVV